MITLATVILLFHSMGEVKAKIEPINNKTSYEWCINYINGTQDCKIATEETTLQPTPGLKFNVTARLFPEGVWSEPSTDAVLNPFLGDVDYDCVVGSRDWITVVNRIGEACE